MTIRNNATRWGWLSMALHWLVVFLIVGQFVLTSLAEDLPLGLQKLIVLARHKSDGILILALVLVRLLWRRYSPGPALPGGLKPWERVLAHLTHYGLYALLLVTPLMGWLMSSAKGYSVSFFNLFPLPNLVGRSDAVYDFTHEAHELLAWAMAVLVGLHVLAALKHHFVLKDNVLRRMLPFTKFMFIGALLLGAGVARPASWRTDPAQSTLSFSFVQAGASNTGRFAKFTVSADAATSQLVGGSLIVSIDTASLDTQDKDRDTTLRGADLFSVAKFPAARFSSTKLVADKAGTLSATGTLTIRGVSRTVTLPLTRRNANEAGREVVYLRGNTTLQRLDFGVGQGDWKSTEWVGNDVAVQWALRLVPMAAPAAKAPAASKAAASASAPYPAPCAARPRQP